MNFSGEKGSLPARVNLNGDFPDFVCAETSDGCCPLTGVCTLTGVFNFTDFFPILLHTHNLAASDH